MWRRWITALSGSARARNLARALRLHTLANAWLSTFPLVRRLPGSGVRYRAARLESIPLAVEMFEKGNLYDASLLPAGFETFIDLGCNVGYFTCWLAHLAKGRPLRGILLDANPEAVAEAQWHAQANEWQHVAALHGVVGEGQPGDFVPFHLYESNICSTRHLPDAEALGLKGRWQTIHVPCVRVADAWTERFGNARCHLLKIDVEGAELDFLRAERAFLAQVDSVLVEWHEWRVTLPELRALLESEGLRYVKTVEQGVRMGTAFFRREAGGA